jgi:hypothetical protein
MSQREYAAKQAIASACIEGFEPDDEFLNNWNSFVKEEITGDEMRQCIIAMALKNEEMKLKHVA